MFPPGVGLGLHLKYLSHLSSILRPFLPPLPSLFPSWKMFAWIINKFNLSHRLISSAPSLFVLFPRKRSEPLKTIYLELGNGWLLSWSWKSPDERPSQGQVGTAEIRGQCCTTALNTIELCKSLAFSNDTLKLPSACEGLLTQGCHLWV